MYTLKLSLADRFQLINRIPQKGSYQKLICANSVKSVIEVTAQEVDDFQIEEMHDETNPDQITGIKWNPEVDTTKEFNINTKGELSILLDIIKSMSANEELTMANISMAQQIFDASTTAGIYKEDDDAPDAVTPIE